MDGQVLLAVPPQDSLCPREISSVPWAGDFKVGAGKAELRLCPGRAFK